jgi:hypothetical protein
MQTRGGEPACPLRHEPHGQARTPSLPSPHCLSSHPMLLHPTNPGPALPVPTFRSKPVENPPVLTKRPIDLSNAAAFLVAPLHHRSDLLCRPAPFAPLQWESISPSPRAACAQLLQNGGDAPFRLESLSDREPTTARRSTTTPSATILPS